MPPLTGAIQYRIFESRPQPRPQPATVQPQYSHSATVQPQYSHSRRSHSHSHSHGHSHSHSHTPIHEGIHTGGRREAPPPCVEAARSAASFMDGCLAEAVAEAEVVEGGGYYDLRMIYHAQLW